MTESRFRVPHTLVLLFGMILLAFALTQFLPQGSFERVTNSVGREQVVPASYAPLEQADRLPPSAIFTSIPHGFEAAGEIIFFIFIIGGAFGVFRATGAADAAIGAMLRRLGERPAVLIAGGILLFAVGSSTIGMAEEYLPFVPLIVALTLALGMDEITGVAVMCIGYGVGYGTALINPFTVFIAQDVAGVQQGTGLTYRLVLLAVFFVIGFHHTWRYASRVKKDPSRSLMAGVETDAGHERVDMAAQPRMTETQKLVIALVGVTLAVLIWGLKARGWYLIEMGALFLALALAIGVVGRLGADGTAREFCVGAAELTTTAILVGFARAIQVVLDDGMVVDTIINALAQPLQRMGAELAAVGMFLVQSVLNFFIPSGSGQAYVTMPIMAPLADLVGVTRQVSVLAFQFGDGFTNILVPTNAVLVGILAIAGVPYDRWFRFVIPFMLKVWIVGSIALAIAVRIGFS